MNRPKVPCRGCEERTVTCHADCPRYKTFVQENAAYSAEGRTARDNYLRFPPRIRAIDDALRKAKRRK